MQADTVVCIGSGESLTQADVDYCRGRAPVLVINENYRLAPWADWIYACDGDWWLRNRRVAQTMRECWTMHEDVSLELGLNHVEGIPGFGLSLDPTRVFWGGHPPVGGNSGAQGVQKVFQLARPQRIVLLGYDMAGNHWHEDHAAPHNPTENHFRHWREGFKVLAAELALQAVELVNCSRHTTLQGIRRAALQDVL